MLSGGLEQTVTRPIIITLCKDVMKMLQMDSDTYVQYGDQVLLDSSSTGRNTLSKSLPNKLLSVSVKENPVDGSEVSRMPLHTQTGKFYKDDEAQTSAGTIYKDMELHLEIKFRTKSKADVSAMINRIGLMTADGSYFNRHDLHISYELPPTVGTFIGEVLKIKQSVYPNLTGDEYTEATFDLGRVDRINSMSSLLTKSSYVIREAQTEVIGYIDGELNNREAQEEDQYHVLELTYTIQYLKPIAINIDFPILIYNRTLPDAFTQLNTKPPINPRHFDSYKDLEELLVNFKSFGINYNGYYLTHPPQDDFTQPYELGGYQAVMSLLTLVKDDPVDNKIFNINNIGELHLKQPIIDLLLYDKDNVGKLFESMFYLALYENDRIDHDNPLYLDNDGNVCYTKPLDKSKSYRVFMYLANNPSQLNGKSKVRTLKYLNDEIAKGHNKKIEGSMAYERVSDVEQYKTEELFLDTYFSFFQVSDEVLLDGLNRVSQLTPGEVLFKIKMPDFGWGKLTMQHHTDVSKLIRS